MKEIVWKGLIPPLRCTVVGTPEVVTLLYKNRHFENFPCFSHTDAYYKIDVDSGCNEIPSFLCFLIYEKTLENPMRI